MLSGSEHVADASYYRRIFQIPKLGTKLKQDSIPLSYTPRKFIPHPHNGFIYLIEGDHRVLGEEAANKQLQQLVGIPSFPAQCASLIPCSLAARGGPQD